MAFLIDWLELRKLTVWGRFKLGRIRNHREGLSSSYWLRAVSVELILMVWRVFFLGNYGCWWLLISAFSVRGRWKVQGGKVFRLVIHLAMLTIHKPLLNYKCLINSRLFPWLLNLFSRSFPFLVLFFLLSIFYCLLILSPSILISLHPLGSSWFFSLLFCTSLTLLSVLLKPMPVDLCLFSKAGLLVISGTLRFDKILYFYNC